MIALEYHCWHCKPTHEGRFFKRPDEGDLARYAEAEGRLRRFIPSPGRSCAGCGGLE